MVDRLVHSEANARRIAAVEGAFGNSGQPLNIPGRVLVGEGVLIKMCRKKPKPRQFFLFNDILIYGNILIAKKRYNKQHVIPLEDVSLEDLQDDGGLFGEARRVFITVMCRIKISKDLKNGWLIKTRTKSFAVYAATNTEKKEWMVHINRCITDLLAKSGKQAASEHAAVWVPDSDAPVCMMCRKTQFSVIQRRHHCRNCGAVVCGSCSSKKFSLPRISRNPVRVCVRCWESLSTASSSSLPTTSPSSGDPESDGESSGSEDEAPQGDGQPNLQQDESTFYGPSSPPT